MPIKYTPALQSCLRKSTNKIHAMRRPALQCGVYSLHTPLPREPYSRHTPALHGVLNSYMRRAAATVPSTSAAGLAAAKAAANTSSSPKNELQVLVVCTNGVATASCTPDPLRLPSCTSTAYP